MTESEIQIESLPLHLLENIFFYVNNVKLLRQVSKYFKAIVDDSSILMRNYWLNVTQCDQIDSREVSSYYENMKFTHLTPESFKFVMDYQQKKNIKEIFINVRTDNYIWSSFMMMQYILLNFSNLQEIYFSLDTNSTCDYRDRVKLVYSPNMKMKTLTIECFDENTIDFLLYAFSKIKSIKVLNLICYGCDISFPEIEWKLEEFRFDSSCFTDPNILKEFILKQTQLKVLRVHDTLTAFDVIARQLPYLERIDLHFNSSIRFDDEFLLTNEFTKELSFLLWFDVENFPLEAIIKHYKNIEKLYIFTCFIENLIIPKIDLPKLQFLSIIQHAQITVLAKFPNLKKLHIRKIDLETCRIAAENFTNIEELSFRDFHDIDGLISMLRKCTSLRYLNLGRVDFPIDLNFIKKMLQVVPTLRTLGMMDHQLKGMSWKEFLAKINSDRLNLKIFIYGNDLEDEYNTSWYK